MWVHARVHIHQGRRSSGTRAESSHLIAGGFTTQLLWCGREMQFFQQKTRELPFFLMCWWLFQICSARGCFSRSELQTKQTTRCGWRILMKSVMTLTCLLGVEGCECARQKTSLPFSMGGVGLRSAARTSMAACRSSWADTFSLIRIHHPTVTDDVVITLSANLGGIRLQGANICRRRLQDAGLDAPKWEDLSRGLRLGQRGLDEAPEPGAPRHGWQRHKKMQAGVVTSTRWTNGWTLFHLLPRFDAQVFRVLLLRRPWCPLPLSGASCLCGRPLDSCGHHRAACPLAWVLVTKGSL